MIKRKLLLCTSIAALSLGTGAFAQAERMTPKGGVPTAKDMAPPSGGEVPAGRDRPSASDRAADRATPDPSDHAKTPQAESRNGNRTNPGDAVKSREDDHGSANTRASDGEGDRGASGANDKREKRANDKTKSNHSKEDGSSTGASDGTAGTNNTPSASVTQLSGEKRTQVQSVFRSHKSEGVVKDIDINVSVGVAVPRSVSLYTVPEDVLIIVPEYRRYRFFIFGDKVVIVNPNTYEIVDVLVLA